MSNQRDIMMSSAVKWDDPATRAKIQFTDVWEQDSNQYADKTLFPDNLANGNDKSTPVADYIKGL